MVEYICSLFNIKEDNLIGFFSGWSNPPNTSKHLEILKNSNHFWLAVEVSSGNVIGFINAISDKTLSAYIPLLEVLPEYRNKGIGTELVRRMLTTLEEYYMVDLVCEENLVNFYKRFEMFEGKAMLLRNFKQQNGK